MCIIIRRWCTIFWRTKRCQIDIWYQKSLIGLLNCRWGQFLNKNRFLPFNQLLNFVISFKIYRFDTANNCCIAQFNNSRSIGGVNWFYIDANRSKCIEFTTIRPNTMCKIISIVFFRMDNSKHNKREKTWYLNLFWG